MCCHSNLPLQCKVLRLLSLVYFWTPIFVLDVLMVYIPRESYHMSSQALGLDISQNCYQKFVTFVPIE